MILPGIKAAMAAYERETGERLRAICVSQKALALLSAELGARSVYRIGAGGRCTGLVVDGCAVGLDGSD